MTYQKEQKKKVAICLANIIKISFSLLGYAHFKRYIELGEKCELYAKDSDSGINKNEDWYKEFLDIMKRINELAEQDSNTEEEMKEKIKKKYKKKFDEIDSKYTNRRNDNEFIDYILELMPYNGYEEDKRNNILEQKKRRALRIWLNIYQLNIIQIYILMIMIMKKLSLTIV
jgi:predicted nuclease with TOPRIM domain